MAAGSRPATRREPTSRRRGRPRDRATFIDVEDLTEEELIALHRRRQQLSRSSDKLQVEEALEDSLPGT